MGFRFHKVLRLSRFARINLSKTGASLSVGRPGVTRNISAMGVQDTFSLPGTGLSYRSSRRRDDESDWSNYLLAVVLGVAMLAFFLLAGCAAPGHQYYAWVKDPNRIKCDHMTWRKVSFDEMILATGKRTVTAAAFGCDVISVYSESEAKVVMADGEPLWNHEARHVFEQMEHQLGGSQ